MKIDYHQQTSILYAANHCHENAINPETPPIYHSTAYIVEDTKDYDFANGGGKYFYSRSSNPNRDGLADAISYLEEGEATLCTSSGMAAISTVLLSLLKQGDHILFSKAIYGETIELAKDMLINFGVEVSFADFTNIQSVQKEIRTNTKILYTEIIANPLTEIVDIRAIVALAKASNSLTIVDSSFTTPFAIKPLTLGVDIVVHSLTKYFGGHSDVTGGSITSTENIINAIKLKFVWLGGCMDPNSAWLLQRSMATMEMRVSAQFGNAKKLAEKLCEFPQIKEVYYPGLENHFQHKLATEILNGYYGGIISFRVENNREKVDSFIKELKLIKYLGTLGGIRSSLSHPLTAFRNEFTPEELKSMGMDEGLIRISVGAENINDLINDISTALKVF